MDDSRYIELVFLFLSYVLLTNQAMSSDITGHQCPLVDASVTFNEKTVLNFTRAAKCQNGRKMSGCCVERIYCDYNTSHVDLTLYGPRYFQDSCDSKDVCCPIQFILPIPLRNNTNQDDDSKWDDSDNHVD